MTLSIKPLVVGQRRFLLPPLLPLKLLVAMPLQIRERVGYEIFSLWLTVAAFAVPAAELMTKWVL